MVRCYVGMCSCPELRLISLHPPHKPPFGMPPGFPQPLTQHRCSQSKVLQEKDAQTWGRHTQKVKRMKGLKTLRSEDGREGIQESCGKVHHSKEVKNIECGYARPLEKQNVFAFHPAT